MRLPSMILAALALTASFVFGEEPATPQQSEKKAAAAPNKPQALPRVTIGKDTTFVTGPLREDGTVDFLAAINEHASQGVTPENNGAIPFWQIVGPGKIEQPMREAYFQKLGIETPPQQGEYYIGFEEYLKLVEEGEAPGADLLTDDDPARAQEKRNLIYEQQSEAAQRIWSAEEFPLVAGWLARNEKQLDRMATATQRARFYSPYVEGDEETYSVIAMLLPIVQASRDVSRALVCRAILRIGEDRIADAQADLLAIHRLARMIAGGGTLLEALVGIAIDGLANAGDQALATSGKLSAKESLDYAAQLRGLEPMLPMYEGFDFTERLMFIDCTIMVARGGMTGLKKVVGEDVLGEPTLQRMVDRVIAGGVNWDTVLRNGNAWHDRLVAAGREPNYAKQKAASAELDQELLALSRNARDFNSFALLMLGNGLQTAVTERTGDLLVSLLLPGTTAAFTAEHRSQVYNELTQFALALAAYHADHKKYPAELAALAPKYLASVPLDRFSGEAFHYTATKDGYLLYSVGMNGEDDEGRNYYYGTEDGKTGDDLTVKAGQIE